MPTVIMHKRKRYVITGRGRKIKIRPLPKSKYKARFPRRFKMTKRGYPVRRKRR